MAGSQFPPENYSEYPFRISQIYSLDATKDHFEQEIKQTINEIRAQGNILHAGDTIIVLGILHKYLHPMGYQMEAEPLSIFGTHKREIEKEVTKKVDTYVNMLMQSAQDCEGEGVDIEVKITAGTPVRKVVVQEVITIDAACVVLDRYLRRDLTYYLKHIPCKVALISDNLFVKVMRPYSIIDADSIENKLYFSLSKQVPLAPPPTEENTEQSVISMNYSGSVESSEIANNEMVTYEQPENSTSLEDFSANPMQERSGRSAREEMKHSIPPVIQKERKPPTSRKSSNTPFLCIACGAKTELYIKDSMRFSFSEIQLATDDFSKDNLLGEGGYGHVYKGRLKDGQVIAAKVRKEASTQGFSEFHSEVYVLSFARHRNIVMLLGYCCKENVNILVYEYICNNSLEWHLFENTENVLDWHRRYAIAIGTAKGLRFLHEECRGGPIIHRDLRPSNILLTHDFVPMIGDFGLAKWKTDEDKIYTRILGSLGYLAPEYAENGIVSVRTDVYSFGIVLIQLISGRKAVDSMREGHHSLRQWAIPLIKRLALHELIDPRIGDSYDTYEVYHMARTAFMCVQNDPELRPSMGEVLRLLQGELEHLHQIVEQFIPHFISK
nr:probable serine/threonine-protein kinase PBL6 isoform X1 [Nicotiana tomentosiformis]